jgi:hypothetical protein
MNRPMPTTIAVLRAVRNRPENGGPETGEDQDQHGDAGKDHQAHHVRPGQAGVRGHGDGHEGVDAQARWPGEGVLGPGAHEDGQDAGNEGGDGRDRGKPSVAPLESGPERISGFSTTM